MYKFIHDETELKWFFDNVLPSLELYETYFVSLSARNKQLTEAERRELMLGRTEMFERKIIPTRDWNRFLSTIKKFEVNDGAYITKNGKSIPQKCLIIYMNINPSDSRKALKEFNNSISEYMYEMTTSSDKHLMSRKMTKLHTLLNNCHQKNRGKRTWIDIDIDIPKDCKIYLNEIVNKYLVEREIEHYWIDTKGGYHLLLKASTLGKYKTNPNDILIKINLEVWSYFCKLENPPYPISTKNDGISTVDGFYEIIINKNAMIPLVGTYQAGHPVTILNKQDKEYTDLLDVFNRSEY